MPHHVYANGNEICSKSAEGKSELAVDVCYSPGAPMPGVPVSYMNMCQAADVTNGSRTVFIKGKEICLEDKSYFATSYGDEPATQGLARGVVSAAVQGRCFFIQWSPNVFAESLAVTRHLDLVTHNHENPGNTPAMPYVSVAAAADECKGDKKAVEEKCKPDPKHKSLLERALGPQKYKKVESLLKKGGLDPNGWIGTHCEGLMIKPDPRSADIQELSKSLEDMTGNLDQIIKDEIEQAIDAIADRIYDKAGDAAKRMAKRKLRNAAIRHGAALGGAAIGGVGAVVTEGVATVWTAGDAVAGAVEGIGTAWDAWSTLSDASDLIKKIPGQLKEAIADATSSPSKAMANFMSILARLNACARARRCMLVPYKDTEMPKALQGDGCCPGQTGHHLLPGEMFYGRSNCPGYADSDSAKHKGAPTICVEGTSNDPTTGSHGLMHSRFADKIADYKKPRWYRSSELTEISYEDARDKAIDTVREVFPESGCDRKCLKAQLDKYYESLCSPNTLSAKAGARPGWLEKKINESSTPNNR